VRVGSIFNYKVYSASSDLPWKLNSTDSPAHVASTSLYFPDIRLIHRKTGTHYTSIMLSLFGGVLSRVLAESAIKTRHVRVGNPNPATFVQLSFPWPNHPLTTLCNHWLDYKKTNNTVLKLLDMSGDLKFFFLRNRTSGGIRVPLGKLSPIDRLKEVDKDYNYFMGSEMDKILKRFLFPIGALFPVKLFLWGFESSRKFTGLRTLFTSAMAYNENYYELDGNPVISVSPLTGLLGSTPGECYLGRSVIILLSLKSIFFFKTFSLYTYAVITGLAFSYKDQVQCTFIASSELAKDQETMDRIVKTYFADEIDKLVEEVANY